MEFDREVHEQYQKAYALAQKKLQDEKKQRLPMRPAALITLLDEKMISYRQDMGILDIPTNLIVGVAEDTEAALLYTKEFLPVSVPNSAYADLWRVLYRDLHAGAEFKEAISCFEYLGKFYVRDGMKRVSVSMYAGIPSIKAHVVRILPMRTDEKEVILYYDFVRQYRLTQLYQLQFTQPGSFEKLQLALGHTPAYRWSDRDRAYFLSFWTSIEAAFHKSYKDSLRISAADALVVLMSKYSLDQIVSMDSWVLARVFQALWREMYTLSFPDKGITQVFHTVKALQTA